MKAAKIAALAISFPLCASCAPRGEDIESVAQGIYDATNQTQGHFSFACQGGGPVIVTGTDGEALAPGAKITGEAVRDVEIDNGLVKVTYELMDQYGANPPSRELGAHMLYRRAGGPQAPYERAFSTAYGDWTYMAAPFQQGAVEAHVLTSNGDVAEVAFVFDHALDFPGAAPTLGHTPSWWKGPGACTPQNGCGCFMEGCGVVERAHDGTPVKIAPYCDKPSCMKRIRKVTLVKTIRVERCAEGYFLGVHADPSLGPKGGAAANHITSYGEREIGTGSWNAVTWASSGIVFKHPGRTQLGWLGIDDPTYVGNPPEQAPGFPAEQPTGPWWIADLPYFNRSDEIPFVRFIALEHRLEAGVWTFNKAQLGSTVVHYVNEEIEPDALPGRYQLFLGATPYVSDDETPCAIDGLSGTWRCFPNEPKPSTTAMIEARLPLSWPR